MKRTDTNRVNFSDIIVKVEANEVFSNTITEFSVTNKDKRSMELKICFPISKNTVLQSFEAVIDGQKVIGKIFEKDMALSKYTDSISRGHEPFIVTMNDFSENVEIVLGYLESCKTVKLTIFTTQLNFSYDKSKLFCFNKMLLPKVEAFKPYKLLGTKCKLIYSATLTTSSPIMRLVSHNYPTALIPNFSKDLMKVDISLKSDRFTSHEDNDFDIVFRTQNMNQPKLYEEYNPQLDLYTYSLNFLFDKYENIKTVDIDLNSLSNKEADLINYVDLNPENVYEEKYDKEEINDYPANFVFLIDQSGSMEGESMELAKESLILFLKSLPHGSNFDIVGFGSDYCPYFETIQSFTEENLSKIISVVKLMKANLGGTNIFYPLRYIYENEISKTKYFGKETPKHIFLLTDGEVQDSENCCKLVRKYYDEFILTAIGIGKEVDYEFIEKIGFLGRGGSYFADNVSTLKQTVIEALNKSLKPYLTKVEINMPEEVKASILYEYPDLTKNRYISQDEIFNYTFVTNKKITNESEKLFSFNYYDRSLDSIITSKDINLLDLVKLNDGSSLNKLVVGLMLNHNPKNISDNKDKANIGVKHQVLCNYTSIFCEVESINNTTLKPKIFRTAVGKSEIDVKHDLICNLLRKKTSEYEIAEKGDDEDGNEQVNFDEENSEKLKFKFDPKEAEKLKVNITSLEYNSKLYEFLIINQDTKGMWSMNKQPKEMTLISSSFSEKSAALRELLISKNLPNLEDVIITVIILLILKEKYDSLKQEYKLVFNKSVKTLAKLGVDFYEIIKS